MWKQVTTMLISQVRSGDGRIIVLARHPGAPHRIVAGDAGLYGLAQHALVTNTPLTTLIEDRLQPETLDLSAALSSGAALPPILHPDPCHLHISGTGLTHLGSASARQAMHHSSDASEVAAKTDSMKLFEMGLAGGKPADGSTGVQPEWFYKGNGFNLVSPGAPLPSPDFALDGGEEPELAGIYIIGPDGTPFRIGFSLANEFSDHVTEKLNYLYLAHSKLRPASIGPEIRLGDAPASVAGTSRIIRNDKTLWEKPFFSGEENMSHSLHNLEHHHFKYSMFRKPGDIHVHMFGTALLSFNEGISTQFGDVFEIEAPDFGLPLRNPLTEEESPSGRVVGL